MLLRFYNLLGYLMGWAAFVYLIGFVGNRYTFSTIDSGLQIPTAEAAVKDILLLSLFGLQHSLMARRWWKARFPAVSRTTYVLAASIILFLIYRYWEPMPEPVWHCTNDVAVAALHVLFWTGWATLFFAAACIGHAELFGLRRSQSNPFREPGPYRIVRHPMMLGLLVALWATPAMSQGHLFFASFFTVYVVIALRWEEGDLEAEHGEAYRSYQIRVPQFIPGRRRR